MSPNAIEAARKLFEDRSLDPSLLDMISDEPLVPELQRYLVKSPLGQTLRHPLVLHVMFSSVFAQSANRTLAHKREKLTEADKRKDFSTAIMLHERPFRLQAFLDRQWDMVDSDYWHNLSRVWIDSEFPYVNDRMWRTLWNSPRPEKHWSMKANDHRMFDYLSRQPELTVWRGAGHSLARRGLSWTTDKDKAQWFADRFGDRGKDSYLWQLTIPGSKIIAYLSDRGESEVILDSSRIPLKKIIRLTGGES